MRLAACGMDCAACASYRATMEGDREAAESLVAWYRGNGWIGPDEGAQAVLDKNPLCKGCWDSSDECFFQCGCGSVDFRICCAGRGIAHCGRCVDFPCENYMRFVDMSGHHLEAMDRLKREVSE